MTLLTKEYIILSANLGPSSLLVGSITSLPIFIKTYYCTLFNTNSISSKENNQFFNCFKKDLIVEHDVT